MLGQPGNWTPRPFAPAAEYVTRPPSPSTSEAINIHRKCLHQFTNKTVRDGLSKEVRQLMRLMNLTSNLTATASWQVYLPASLIVFMPSYTVLLGLCTDIERTSTWHLYCVTSCTGCASASVRTQCSLSAVYWCTCTIYGIAPTYIADFCSRVANVPDRASLRSASHHHLVIPFKITKFGDRSFSVAGPIVWNILCDYIKLATSVDDYLFPYHSMFCDKSTTWSLFGAVSKALTTSKGMFYNKEQRDPNSLLLYARYSSIVKDIF